MSNRPEPTGEYAVGTFTYTVFNDREELLEPGSQRSIPVRVYYPVLKESVKDMTKAKYMTKEMAQGLSKAMGFPINYDKEDAAGNNVSNCYQDAPKIEGKKFPLVVFNHGLMSFRESNSFLCIELASHGYVVISVGHPHEAGCTELDDGTKLYFKKEIKKKQFEPYFKGMKETMKLIKAKDVDERVLAQRFDEVQRNYSPLIFNRVTEWAKDSIAAVKYAKDNLSEMIDFECGIGVTGHSLGGATAYVLCLDYPEFVCGVNLDGALYGDTTGKVLTKPFIQIGCKENYNLETRPFLDHKSPVWSVFFSDMKHMGFSDLKHAVNVKMLVGKLDADVVHDTVCKCHLELFDTYIKKTKEKPVIEGDESVSVKEYAPDL